MRNNPLMQKTLAALRKEGLFPAVVERWNPHMKCRQDLWGFCDVLVMDTFRQKFIAVQVCDSTSYSKHRKKLLEERRARIFIASGGEIVLWSWKRKGRLRIEHRKETFASQEDLR